MTCRMNSSEVEHTPVKSNAVVKYSASQSPATFAQLQCNTDLNLPPSNWLSSSANTYGFQYVFSQSTGFSSFRLAHMFPDCVGEVDVVSDAENIKNLLKLPYSHGQVSMMVHRIENTLLIDDFDIYKHLLRTAEKEWEWLRKFFYEHVRKSLTEKDGNKYIQNKSRSVLRQKSLVSKFLYHSLVQDGTDDVEGDGEAQEPENFQVSGPALPDPSIEEEVPDPTSNHKYNRNVVWTFEDIQMLIGTDIPIFGGGTHPCISLRLRDMTSPINVLTGIDYWLDNLMSNVPEVVMCYHLNGIVQKYELVKTEDLPYLENSKFSPSVIRDIAQNILSFLKSNATKPGHTYWLFKSKDDDVVKLYDLTSLCGDEGQNRDQNPFTVPVAMLLYRVARNMKHTSGRKQPGTIRMLLKHCVQLLSKEKYPQIVTSSHYMMSDLFVPAHTDPAAPGLEQMETDDMESCYEDDLNDSGGQAGDPAMKQLRLSAPPDHASSDSAPPPPPISGTLDERCEHALEHVLFGLECLQFFPNQDKDTESAEELRRKVEKARQREEEENPKMAKPFQVIPMPYSKINDDTVTKKKDKKSKKKKGKTEQNNNQLNSPTALLPKNNDTIPTWQEPDRSDNASWNSHLKTLLYEKACLVFAILAEQDYVVENYGSSLRSISMLMRCQQLLQILKYTSRNVQESCILGRAGDACFMIVKNWDKLEKYQEQFKSFSVTSMKILDEIRKEYEETEMKDRENLCDILPDDFESIEQMLLASCQCYEKALLMDPLQEVNSLYRRLGNVQNEIGVFYMSKASTCSNNYEEYNRKVFQYLQSGIKLFEAVKDDANLALLHSNMGRLMRICAHFNTPDDSAKRKVKGQEKHFYNKALESYQKALQVLGNRRSNPEVWDTVSWELSSLLFTRAQWLQDYPIGNQDETKAEREVVETLQKALQYCDMETPGPRQPIYQYRVSCIHQRLASLYHNSYRKMASDNPRRKNILQLCKLHYERACKLLKFLEQHNELLKSMLERVALSELLSKNVSNAASKIRHLQYCLYLLTETIPSLLWLIEKKKIPIDDATKNPFNETETETDQNLDETADIDDSQVLTYVRTIEQQLQYALRMLAKLCLNKTGNKDCDNISEIYKSLYSQTLKTTNQSDWRGILSNLYNILKNIQSSKIKLVLSEN